jgi:hypothetical protein
MQPDPQPAPQPDIDVSSAQIVSVKSAPMSESRLKDRQEQEQEQESQVTFSWGVYDPGTGKRERDRTEPLPVDEFLRRLVQHVSPSYYRTVRHYGLSASGKAKKDADERCREFLSDREPESMTPDPDDEATDTDAWIAQHTCPVCGKPLMVSSSIPSSVTGRCIPRVPIGHVFAPCSSLGGGHDP